MAENKKHIINDENNYESVSILLSKEKYPIAFEKYVKDMMNGGMTREQAEKYASETPIELELYYQVGFGLFGLSSDYVDNMESFVSPYNGDEYELESDKM